MKKRTISTPTLALAVAVALAIGITPSKVFGQQRSGSGSLGWSVWVKTSPCSGRFDWLTVAQGNPTGGGNTFVAYQTLLPLSGCAGPEGCSFRAAEALRESLRGHPKFFDLCCREYSVWENSQTFKRTIVLGKLGTAGFGWRFVKGQLCCEEAEALAGIPGACSSGYMGTAAGCKGFGGRWETAYGPLTLVTDGARVTGNYTVEKGPGRIVGTLRGSVLEGEWIQSDRRGGLRFTLAADGLSFSGRWWEADGTGGGSWDGKCAAGAGTSVSLEQGSDRPGQDYRSLDLAASNPELCRAECAADPKCRAYVYVKPGVQGPNARCWLKSGVPNPVPSACCVSGVKSGHQGGGVVYTGEGDTVGVVHKPKVVELSEDADEPTPRSSEPAPARPGPTPNRPGVTRPQAGSLKLVATDVRPSTGDNAYTYTRAATSASARHQFEPGNLANALIQWNFSGVPGSLNPGQEFTITITGSVTRGARFASSPTATVSTHGLEIVKAEPAVMNTDVPFSGGTYVFRVPRNAEKVTINFQADWNIGTFATYRYEK